MNNRHPAKEAKRLQISRIKNFAGKISIISKSIPTWFLFLILILLNLLNVWLFQEKVFTLQLFDVLTGQQLSAARLNEQFRITTDFVLAGYLLSPIVVVIKSTFLAFTFQFVMLLQSIEIRFTPMIRIVFIAAFAELLGDLSKTLWLYSLTVSRINPALLQIRPDSVILLFDSAEWNGPARILMSHLSLTDLFWFVIMTLGIKNAAVLKGSDAALTAFAVWGGLVSVQGILFLYLHYTGI